MDRFLEDVSVLLLGMSDADMDAILNGTTVSEPALNKSRLPGSKKVTRKLKYVFDLSVFEKRDEKEYKMN